jgi:hypothetical protein
MPGACFVDDQIRLSNSKDVLPQLFRFRGHGGPFASAETQAGEGTRFIVALPVQRLMERVSQKSDSRQVRPECLFDVSLAERLAAIQP